MKFFNKVFDIFGIIAFVGMMLVVLMQITCRFLLKVNVPWTEEMSRLLFIFLCFLGTAIAFREKEFIVIDFLIRKIDNSFKKYLSILISLFTFSFFVVVLLGSLIMVGNVWPTRLSTMDSVSTGWFYIPPIICCFGVIIWTTIDCIRWLVKVISSIRRK